jgi:hypothetical protein
MLETGDHMSSERPYVRPIFQSADEVNEPWDSSVVTSSMKRLRVRVGREDRLVQKYFYPKPADKPRLGINWHFWIEAKLHGRRNAQPGSREVQRAREKRKIVPGIDEVDSLKFAKSVKLAKAKKVLLENVVGMLNKSKQQAESAAERRNQERLRARNAALVKAYVSSCMYEFFDLD